MLPCKQYSPRLCTVVPDCQFYCTGLSVQTTIRSLGQHFLAIWPGGSADRISLAPHTKGRLVSSFQVIQTQQGSVVQPSRKLVVGCRPYRVQLVPCKIMVIIPTMLAQQYERHGVQSERLLCPSAGAKRRSLFYAHINTFMYVCEQSSVN